MLAFVDLMSGPFSFVRKPILQGQTMFQLKSIASLLLVASFTIIFTLQPNELSAQQLSRKQAAEIFQGLRKHVGTKKVRTSGGISMLKAMPDQNMPKFPPKNPGGKQETAEIGRNCGSLWMGQMVI